MQLRLSAVQAMPRLALLAAALALTSGCQTTLDLELPSGYWSGNGYYFTLPSHEGSDAPPRSGEYHTWLKLDRTDFEGRPAFRFEVMSMRGPIRVGDPSDDRFGDRTHLIFHLEPTRSPNPGVMTFAIVDAYLSMNSEAPERTEPPNQPVDATLALLDKRYLSLQVRYADGFVDTYVFRDDNNELIKAGSFAPSEGAGSDQDGMQSPGSFIFWSEHLTRGKRDEHR